MGPILLIARKDLRQRLRDKSAFIYGIIAPFALAFVFSLVFGPLDDTSGGLAEYIVVDQDGGTLAGAFTDMLDAVAEDGTIAVRELDSESEARDQVEAYGGIDTEEGADTADVAFIIPDGFSDAIEGGGGSEIVLVASGASELGVQIADSLANGFAAEVGAIGLSIQAAIPMDAPPDPAYIESLLPLASAAENPLSIEDVSARTKQLDYKTYLAAGMSVFFVFFTVLFGVNGLLEERHNGTMARLLAAPISRNALIIGKILTAMVMGVISMSVLAIGSTLLFGASWGNPVGVGILIVGAVASATGILAVVAALAKTPEQAGNFGAIISLVLGFMGGTFFQVSQVTGILDTLSLLTPHSWFLRGLAELKGGALVDILPHTAALLAFGLITGGLAWPLLRRSVQR